ncbi:MAG: excinuclease ABC subunit C, partial [Phycisphaeraceae bacterium]|nr:excinuclease ABC subunit C [Phycisphaeraceae bacterium]
APKLLVVDEPTAGLDPEERIRFRNLVSDLADEIPVAGLAKRFEEIYVPGRSQPVEIPRGSEALFMLQRIRDEAHRFANSFHRERRSKRMTVSALDGIVGLGEVRKKKLTQAMGGVNAIKRASLDELKANTFLPDAVAEAIYAKFQPPTAP